MLQEEPSLEQIRLMMGFTPTVLSSLRGCGHQESLHKPKLQTRLMMLGRMVEADILYRKILYIIADDDSGLSLWNKGFSISFL